jgi:hypothetical protein
MVGKEEEGTFEYVRICGFPIPSQTHLLLPFFLTQQNTTKPKHNNKSLKPLKIFTPTRTRTKTKTISTTTRPPPQQQQYLHHHNHKTTPPPKFSPLQPPQKQQLENLHHHHHHNNNNKNYYKIFTTATTTTTTTKLWVNFKCVANRFLGTTPQPNAELERQI